VRGGERGQRAREGVSGGGKEVRDVRGGWKGDQSRRIRDGWLTIAGPFGPKGFVTFILKLMFFFLIFFLVHHYEINHNYNYFICVDVFFIYSILYISYFVEISIIFEAFYYFQPFK
jgi:hypothetical protein